MTKKAKNLVIIFITIAIFAVLMFLTILPSRIPLTNDDTVGNTPGNLNNGGYFCESDGRVYFANAYDDYALYSMNADESDIKKINDGAFSCLNVGGDYLYYSMIGKTEDYDLGFIGKPYGVYRSKLNGKKATGMDRCHIINLRLCGNYVFYEKYDNKEAVSLEKIRIDKKEKQTVAPKTIINPNCYIDGKIYYNGDATDHYLYALDTATGVSEVVWEGNLWNPIVQDGYVYYMDVDNDYRLCRYSFNNDTIEVLTNERLDMFNLYDHYIYYQVSSPTQPALKRMRIDGSSQELVKEGVFQNINITSQYVYFNAFNEPTPVYKTSTFGPVGVTSFDTAMQAALKEAKPDKQSNE